MWLLVISDSKPHLATYPSALSAPSTDTPCFKLGTPNFWPHKHFSKLDKNPPSCSTLIFGRYLKAQITKYESEVEAVIFRPGYFNALMRPTIPYFLMKFFPERSRKPLAKASCKRSTNCFNSSPM